MRKWFMNISVATALTTLQVTLALAPVHAAGNTESPEFAIGAETLSMPLSYFVLIRIGSEVGAFRFLSAKEADFGRLGTSEYESYGVRRLPQDGGGLMGEKRIGTINIKQLKGVHPFAWQPGQNVLRVGQWKFRCLAPRLVDLSDGAPIQKLNIEVALTAVTRVDDLDPTANSLQWYRMDGHSTRRVRIDDLEKRPSGSAPQP